MMDIVGIINKIKTKCNEYGVRLKCEDIPGSNAKKLGLEYNGGRFDVQISDNKIDEVSVDWSAAENQKIVKDLISMTQVPVIDLPADNDEGYIALSECGRDSLFGGMCVAAVWIHPDSSHREDLLNIIKSITSNVGTGLDEKYFKVRRYLVDKHQGGSDSLNLSMFNILDMGFVSPDIYVELVRLSPTDYNTKLQQETHNNSPDEILIDMYCCAIKRLLSGIPSLQSKIIVIGNSNSLKFGFPDSNIDLSYEAINESNENCMEMFLANMFARTDFLTDIEELGILLGKKIPIGNDAAAKEFYEKRFKGLDESKQAEYMKLKY